MPYTYSGRVRVYWEEQGHGEPLLMIMGLGFSMKMWQNLRPLLAERFRIIVFDNRGVGNTDSTLAPFSVRTMADDAAAVLNAAGVDSAHVFGVSMGGMIAQELVLSHPGRVRKLVLGCTQCGGPLAEPPHPEIRKILSPFTIASRAHRTEALVPFLYDPHTPRERIDRDLDVVRRYPPHILGYLLQLRAIVAWRSYERLPQIRQRTLVIHGDTDRLIPPSNGYLIAARIPDCQLVILPQASHIFPTDQPELTMRHLMDFLTT